MSKTLICIDSANLHYYLDEKGWGINWEKFRNYISGLFGNTTFIFYDMMGLGAKTIFSPLSKIQH